MDQQGIDHRELRQMTDQVDHLHHETMRTIHDELFEAHLGAGNARRAGDRRQFLKAVGAGGAVAAFASTTVSLASLTPAAFAESTTASLTSGDLAIIQFAQGLELAAVAVYRAAVDAGRLDTMAGEVARTFELHHADHATALGTLAGKAAPNVANSQLVQLFEPRITRSTDAKEVMRVLYDLEEGAAATYELALGAIEQGTTAAPVATILPVEGQHAVVWGQALDLRREQWLPARQSTDGALDPSQYATS